MKAHIALATLSLILSSILTTARAYADTPAPNDGTMTISLTSPFQLSKDNFDATFDYDGNYLGKNSPFSYQYSPALTYCDLSFETLAPFTENSQVTEIPAGTKFTESYHSASLDSKSLSSWTDSADSEDGTIRMWMMCTSKIWPSLFAPTLSKQLINKSLAQYIKIN